MIFAIIDPVAAIPILPIHPLATAPMMIRVLAIVMAIVGMTVIAVITAVIVIALSATIIMVAMVAVRIGRSDAGAADHEGERQCRREKAFHLCCPWKRLGRCGRSSRYSGSS